MAAEVRTAPALRRPRPDGWKSEMDARTPCKVDREINWNTFHVHSTWRRSPINCVISFDIQNKTIQNGRLNERVAVVQSALICVCSRLLSGAASKPSGPTLLAGRLGTRTHFPANTLKLTGMSDVNTVVADNDDTAPRLEILIQTQASVAYSYPIIRVYDFVRDGKVC